MHSCPACLFQALICLENDLKIGPHKKFNIVEEQAKCNSDEAIPLHYEPLKQSLAAGSRSATSERSRSDELQMTYISQEKEGPKKDQTWHQLSKGLLFRKAALTFSAMAKNNLNKSQFTESLKYLKLAMYCFGKIYVIFLSNILKMPTVYQVTDNGYHL